MAPLRTVLAAAAAAAVAAFSTTPIMVGYAGTPPCFRQPVLVVVPGAPPTVLAFVEGRTNNYCSGTNDGDNSTILLRRSLDGGATWLPLQWLLVNAHPDFLAAMHDAATGTTHLMVEDSGTTILYLTSADAGATWSAPAKLPVPNSRFKAPVIPAVGHGIKLEPALCREPTCAGAVGSLLMPMICKTPLSTGADDDAARVRAGDIACPNCFSCVLASADGGMTWALAAASAQNGSREAALVQVDSATWGATGAGVYATERNMGNATGSRWHAVSLDGGATFSEFARDPSLPDGVTANWTGIVAGAARFDTADGKRRVIFTTPASRTARADLGIWSSTDEAQTWSGPTQLWAGPAGYSDVAQLNATHWAILYENGAAEFAQQVSFGVGTAADLPA